MRRRHLPRTWLLTDPRMGDALWPALERLPRGSGVVLRHYDDALATRVRAVTRRRGLWLVVAGDARDARRLRAEGVHIGVRGRGGGGLTTASAHNVRELVAARRAGAHLVFVSPVFATRSHPGAATLGPVRFELLVRGAGVAVAALGGMSADCFGRLPGAYGWGAIDAWLTPDEKGRDIAAPAPTRPAPWSA